MQLSPTKGAKPVLTFAGFYFLTPKLILTEPVFYLAEDVDRPCRIGCQDADLPYRFYMVNGEEGWFPSGTDCSRGDPDKKAFCLSGKCIVSAEPWYSGS